MYIQPSLNCESMSPRRAALQYKAAARSPSRGTPWPSSYRMASSRKLSISTLSPGAFGTRRAEGLELGSDLPAHA
jgi:hypothetical protein